MTGSPEDIRLVPFDKERDAALLAGWLRAPHVSRWWGDPEEQIADALQSPPRGEHAIITVQGKAVGYLRWERISRADLEQAGLCEIPIGAVDIDIAIGDLNFIGRGVGSAALRILLADLANDPSVSTIMLVTSLENHVALRAFEKAGFRRLREFDDGPYGMSWVLTLNADDIRQAR